MPFRYPCYLEFEKYLGRQIAMLGLSEVAAREFVKKADEQGNESEARRFIERTARPYGIMLNDTNFEAFYHRRHQYYIVQVHEAFEVFCRQFEAEYCDFGNQWDVQTPQQRRKEGDDTLLLEVLRNTPKGNTLKPSPHVAILDYYRLVRNATVHGSERKQLVERYERRLGNIKERLALAYKKERKRSFPFDAPNPIASLSFEDVRLFAYSVLWVAHWISRAACPAPQQIVDMVFRGKGGSSFKHSFNQLRNIADSTLRQERLAKGLRERLIDQYGLTRPEAEEILKQARLPIAQW